MCAASIPPSPRQADTCPSGQSYYVCSATSYVGCCANNPCDTGTCTNANGDPNNINSVTTGAATDSVYSSTTTTYTTQTARTIVPVTTKTTLLTTSSKKPIPTATATVIPNSSSKSPSSLPTVVGIISCVAVLIVLSAIFYCCCCGAGKKRRQARQKAKKQADQRKLMDVERQRAMAALEGGPVDYKVWY